MAGVVLAAKGENKVQEFVYRGSVGNVKFGYLQEAGKRNQWVVICPAGIMRLARDNNMNAAFRDASRLKWEIEGAA